MRLNDEEYIEVSVNDVRGSSGAAEAFLMIMVDKETPNRYLPIMIGINEARAILGEIHNKLPFRPLTHTLFADLFLRIIRDYEIEFVSIDSFNDGIYYASIVIKSPDGSFSRLDARPSDAVAIGMHAAVPIYINKRLFEERHIAPGKPRILEELRQESDFQRTTGASGVEGPFTTSLDSLPLETLQDMLQKAIDEERYEDASDIQAAINRKKGK